MNRGDIVLAIFPHAAGTPSNNRPVLVVQADYYNQRIGNILLAAITSNLARKNDRAHFLIDVSTPDGKNTGLKQNSLVSCLNLAVLPKAEIGQKDRRAVRSIDAEYR
jgi:mRNA-degrading endonuclease toxin of MazEF toxin-antitoxin module